MPLAERLPAPPLADAPPPIVGEPTPGVVRPHEGKLDSRAIPDGEACLQELVRRGISFRTAEERRGITTPIVVEGPLGGVVYRGLGGAPFLCDCRFAVALSWIGPDLLAAGVTEAWYSGVYSYRMARRIGRLSLHAYGLAVDVHEWTVQGKRLTVTDDFERGLSDPCSSTHPLNRLSCVLRSTGLFREMLTPDTDADHHDHFHISIVPLGEDPVRRISSPKSRAREAEAKAGAGDASPKDRKQTESAGAVPLRETAAHEAVDSEARGDRAQKPAAPAIAEGRSPKEREQPAEEAAAESKGGRAAPRTGDETPPAEPKADKGDEKAEEPKAQGHRKEPPTIREKSESKPAPSTHASATARRGNTPDRHAAVKPDRQSPKDRGRSHAAKPARDRGETAPAAPKAQVTSSAQAHKRAHPSKRRGGTPTPAKGRKAGKGNASTQGSSKP